MNDDLSHLLKPFAGRRVLLAERSDHLRQLMSSQINQWRLRTVTTGDGLHALQHALLACQTLAPFDVILLNTLLPGLSGLEIATRLTLNRCPSPIILLGNAGDDAQMIHQALAAGAWDYLPRPFGPDELAGRMRQVFSHSRASSLETQDD